MLDDSQLLSPRTILEFNTIIIIIIAIFIAQLEWHGKTLASESPNLWRNTPMTDNGPARPVCRPGIYLVRPHAC